MATTRGAPKKGSKESHIHVTGDMPALLETGKGYGFQYLPVAAMVVDRNRKALEINEECRRLFSPALADPSTCRGIAHCDITPEHCPLMKALSRQEPVYRTAIHMQTPRGRRLIIERVSPFHDPVTGEQKAVLTFGDATAREHEMNALKRGAHWDHLTGVYTRNYFDRLWQQWARREERRASPSAFLMIDIDGLKHVNDTCGHAAGDDLLARLGKILQSVIRRSDILGRLGGDEFGVFCPHTRIVEARQLAQRLEQAIAKDNQAHPLTFPLHVGIGMAGSRRGPHRALRLRADRKLNLYKTSRRSKRAPS